MTRKESNGSHWFDGISGVSAVAGAGTAQRCAGLGPWCARGEEEMERGTHVAAYLARTRPVALRIRRFHAPGTHVAACLGKKNSAAVLGVRRTVAASEAKRRDRHRDANGRKLP